MLRGPDTRRQEASAAFGFWCRRARLEALAARHASPLPRLGRGLAFHLAPANVPALFAYTLAIGLLAGNANVVRLSSRRMEGEAPLLAALRRVLERPEHAAVRARTSLITYGRDDAVTADYCARCDARIVWGGDATVAAVRAMPMPPTPWSCASPTAGRWRCSASGPSPPSRRRSGGRWPTGFITTPTRWIRTPAPAPNWCCGWRTGETPPAAPGGGRRWPLRRRSATPSAPSRRPASWSGCASAP